MSAASTEGSRRLAESFGLILPSLPAELVPRDAIPWLSATAAVLPPVHRAGLECRLAADEHSVDLQQGIYNTGTEPAHLASFLAEADSLNDVWQPVLRFASRWSVDTDVLHQTIDEIWLELDAAAGPCQTSVALNDTHPSVFAVLKRLPHERSLAVAQAALDTLLGTAAHVERTRMLERCAAACPSPSRISHVGVMLGRAVCGLRVHIGPMPLQELDVCLEQLGWSGDRPELHSFAKTLVDHGDTLILCLDLADGHVVRVGLECFFDQKTGLDPRWRPLLEHLVNAELASPDKAAALLRWPGSVTPLTAGGAWPEDLVVQSLTRPEDVLGVIERRLSHVKLTFAPGLPVSAKAYFGYGPVWADSGTPGGSGVSSDSMWPARRSPQS